MNPTDNKWLIFGKSYQKKNPTNNTTHMKSFLGEFVYVCHHFLSFFKINNDFFVLLKNKRLLLC